jgi:hypothetical protein
MLQQCLCSSPSSLSAARALPQFPEGCDPVPYLAFRLNRTGPVRLSKNTQPGGSLQPDTCLQPVTWLLLSECPFNFYAYWGGSDRKRKDARTLLAVYLARIPAGRRQYWGISAEDLTQMPRLGSSLSYAAVKWNRKAHDGELPDLTYIQGKDSRDPS